MRPTFSIICFTVLSGIGYGAWFLIGLGHAIGPVCGPRGAADATGVSLRLCSTPFASASGFLIAFVLVSAGLLCSLGHLGQPRRAWRALSQWRSSWLSREGVAALITFVPAAILLVQGLAEWRWLSGHAFDLEQELTWWNGLWWNESALPALGAWLAFGALLTVFCTANIYACLKPIAAWHNRYVMPVYLLLGLYGGALLLLAASNLPFGWMGWRDTRVVLLGIVVLAAICAWLKSAYWRSLDKAPLPDAGRATGLDRFGSVRSFEQPHTEQNYLTHEMGFVLARKHAHKLRAIALVAAFLMPALLAALVLAVPAAGVVAAWSALALGIGGIFVERWLFFAEAKHAVMAYYAR